jgi:hypothetical protein
VSAAWDFLRAHGQYPDWIFYGSPSSMISSAVWSSPARQPQADANADARLIELEEKIFELIHAMDEFEPEMSPSQQQCEHDHDQQRCRYRDDAVCGEMQPPEANLKSITHSMALHLKKTESLRGTIHLPADLRGRQQGRLPAYFLRREDGDCSNGLMPRSNRRCYRVAVSAVCQMAGRN